jgi:mannose-6-phosphate isomerase
MWGGRKLGELMSTTLPGSEPIGEAWILSDRDDFPSKVANGDLKGQTISQLLQSHRHDMLGSASDYSRYPLLLKFLDAREMLSVQVHPADSNKDLLPAGERGKTEAWVVLDADPESKIFAGLNEGTNEDSMRRDIEAGSVERDLASFAPHIGDGVFIEAGTVHALGGGVVVFEVQQNSDVTFRLYDWNRIDKKTGKQRELHVQEALRCIDFGRGPLHPVVPVIEETSSGLRETLFDCEFFKVSRISAGAPIPVGVPDALRVLVVLEGTARLTVGEFDEPTGHGDVWMLPASVGPCLFDPAASATVLEIAATQT